MLGSTAGVTIAQFTSKLSSSLSQSWEIVLISLYHMAESGWIRRKAHFRLE